MADYYPMIKFEKIYDYYSYTEFSSKFESVCQTVSDSVGRYDFIILVDYIIEDGACHVFAKPFKPIISESPCSYEKMEQSTTLFGYIEAYRHLCLTGMSKNIIMPINQYRKYNYNQLPRCRLPLWLQQSNNLFINDRPDLEFKISKYVDSSQILKTITSSIVPKIRSNNKIRIVDTSDFCNYPDLNSLASFNLWKRSIREKFSSECDVKFNLFPGFINMRHGKVKGDYPNTIDSILENFGSETPFLIKDVHLYSKDSSTANSYNAATFVADIFIFQRYMSTIKTTEMPVAWLVDRIQHHSF